MKTSRHWLRAAALPGMGLALLCAGLFACTGEVKEAKDAANPDPILAAATRAALAAARACEPGMLRQCPCPGAGSGEQACAADGESFGPCKGCVGVPTDGQGADDAAGEADDGLASATMSGFSTGSVVATAGAAGTLDTSMPIDAAAGLGASVDEANSDSDVLQTEALGVAPAGAAPGVSCGVGLPLLCTPDSEKCCIRSLRTDTCIDIAESCECDLPDCVTTTATCDGPEDCAGGQRCCGTTRTGGFGGQAYEAFTCADDCSGSASWEACHEGEGTCPSGLICANSQLLTNLQICISSATIQQ